MSSVKTNDIDEDENLRYHNPVMVEECLDALAIKEGGLYIDCTLGGGGHTKFILQRGGTVIGLDQDSEAIITTTNLLNDYIISGKLEILQSNFRSIDAALRASRLCSERGSQFVDGVLMDLGVSSHQINEPDRGFAFGSNGPLDMRMSRGNGTTSSITAATICNEWSVTAIADALYAFGDEKRSRQIAREIVFSRPLNTTGDLVDSISRITSFKERTKTLARCFQALRIVVNDEMGALEHALSNMHKILRPGGRLVVLSYHSLEDRRVKQLFRTGSPLPSATVGRGRKVNPEEKSSTWIELFRRARGPSEQEIAVNRRARSAKMRAAVRAPLPGELSTISIDEAKLGLGGKQKPLPLVGAKQLAKLAAADNHDDSDDDDGSEEEELPKPKVDEKKKNRHSVFTFNRRQSKVMK